jgi:hypothetical protein
MCNKRGDLKFFSRLEYYKIYRTIRRFLFYTIRKFSLERKRKISQNDFQFTFNKLSNNIEKFDLIGSFDN